MRKFWALAILPLFALEVIAQALNNAAAVADETLTFKIYCARCHGETGHGDGADAATLKAHPRNFTDCATMTKISDQTMFKAIKEGGASVGVSKEMPAWGSSLGDDEIHSVMNYVRHFCKK